jgi:hypothetical protein
VSMWTPMAPDLGQGDDGIPAADPGAGAPPPADGFGVGGEEPDRPEEGGGRGVDEGGAGGQGTGGTDRTTTPVRHPRPRRGRTALRCDGARWTDPGPPGPVRARISP